MSGAVISLNAAAATRLPTALVVDGVAHSYGAGHVLRKVDLRVAKGEIVALLGPSGCGKTTLLKLIAGLIAPSEGRLDIAGRCVADAASGRFTAPEKRGLGMVFQDYALWPHLSVLRNVSFPLEMRGVAREEWRRRAQRALERVGLADYGPRNPGSMSGGQQQRVSIARAIVAEPSLVLFDEPLSSLDRDLRDTLATEIAALIRDLGLSAVYVTHDQGEAFALADRVAVMREGRIEQIAAPERLVADPASPAVCEFLHLGTLVRAERRPDGYVLPEAGLTLAADLGAARPGPGRLLMRRDAVSAGPDARGMLRGRIVACVFRGDHYVLTVRVGADPSPGADILVVTRQRGRAGETVPLDVDVNRLRFFEDGPGTSLQTEEVP